MNTIQKPFPRLISASGEEAALPRDLRERIERAWAVQAQIETLKAELDAHKAILQQILPTGGRAEIPGLCSATLALRSTVTIADAARLQGVLGALWPECVVEEVAYKPTAALTELSADADSPLSGPIRECLSVRLTPALTLKPLRADAGKSARKRK